MWAFLNHFLAGKQSQTEAATLSFPGLPPNLSDARRERGRVHRSVRAQALRPHRKPSNGRPSTA